MNESVREGARREGGREGVNERVREGARRERGRWSWR